MYKPRIIKQDIKTIPFHELESLDEFVSRYALKSAWFWLGPQLLAHLGSYKLPPKNSDGKYDGNEYLRLNLKASDWDQGIHRFLNLGTRSSTMRDKQTSPNGLQYCALVPLYMAAQKKFNSIPYSSWTNLEHLVEPKLFAAMTAPFFEIDRDRLIEIRTIACQGLDPSTSNKLIDVADSELGSLPLYLKYMLLQTWCAHPVNRHEYMVLDAVSWDNMPEPLISTDVLLPNNKPWFTENTVLHKKTTSKLLPWEN